MPTYLCHGFRWYRRSIRPFVILNNLDDCAPDWVIGPETAASILSQLAETYDFIPRLENDDGTITRPDSNTTPTPTPLQEKRPQVFDDDLSMPVSKVPATEDSVLIHEWSPVKLLEEYDMAEMERAARPYAYMADHVVRVDLGADIVAEMTRYENTFKEKQLPWFEKLRVQVQPEEQMRWYVVVCDDANREVQDGEEEDCDEEDEAVEGALPSAKAATTQPSPPQGTSITGARPKANDGTSHGSEAKTSSQHTRETPTQPAFLGEDPFKSQPQPPSRLKKKLSIRRLFSKKDS
jgi:hypothetical protein